MFGKVQLAEFQELTTLPQKAASALGVLNELVGAEYKPVMYVGTQVTQGTNYIFICEIKTISLIEDRKLVSLAINEFNNKYSLVMGSIEVLF